MALIKSSLKNAGGEIILYSSANGQHTGGINSVTMSSGYNSGVLGSVNTIGKTTITFSHDSWPFGVKSDGTTSPEPSANLRNFDCTDYDLVYFRTASAPNASFTVSVS